MEIKKGDSFGRLVVTGKAIRKHYYRFKCKCGNRKVIRIYDLTSGRTKSCGCLKKETVTKHGLSKTQTYRSWINMKSRCTNPNKTRYSDYGGRGISVCKRWMKFENFYEDIGKRPSNTSLERTDNNGNYEPGNCRWATPTEQQRNKRIQKNNNTGISGVSWCKKSQKYQVGIKVNSKRISLGCYKNIEEAGMMRLYAEQELWNR